MRIPRDISGDDLVKKLQKIGYEKIRQVGSHIRLSTTKEGLHHITIPAHKNLRLGTLSAIISDIANHHKKTKEEIIQILFYNK